MSKKEIVHLAMELWEYHNLTFVLKNADYIAGLGSYDVNVAKKNGLKSNVWLHPQVLVSTNKLQTICVH